MKFTAIDIIILIIISSSSFLGLYKGLLNIIINIIAFVLSIFTAITLFPYIQLIIHNHMSSELLSAIVSGVSSYIFSLLFFSIIFSKLGQFITDRYSGFLDRMMGGVFGFLRGVFIVVVIIFIIIVFYSNAYFKSNNLHDMVLNLDKAKVPKWYSESVTTYYAEDVLFMILKIIPESYLKTVKLYRPDQEEIILNQEDK